MCLLKLKKSLRAVGEGPRSQGRGTRTVSVHLIKACPSESGRDREQRDRRKQGDQVKGCVHGESQIRRQAGVQRWRRQRCRDHRLTYMERGGEADKEETARA